MALTIQAVITEVKTTPDQGFRLKLDTQELVPKEALELFFLKGKYVQLTLTITDV